MLKLSPDEFDIRVSDNNEKKGYFSLQTLKKDLNSAYTSSSRRQHPVFMIFGGLVSIVLGILMLLHAEGSSGNYDDSGIGRSFPERRFHTYSLPRIEHEVKTGFAHDAPSLAWGPLALVHVNSAALPRSFGEPPCRALHPYPVIARAITNHIRFHMHISPAPYYFSVTTGSKDIARLLGSSRAARFSTWALQPKGLHVKQAETQLVLALSEEAPIIELLAPAVLEIPEVFVISTLVEKPVPGPILSKTREKLRRLLVTPTQYVPQPLLHVSAPKAEAELIVAAHTEEPVAVVGQETVEAVELKAKKQMGKSVVAIIVEAQAANEQLAAPRNVIFRPLWSSSYRANAENLSTPSTSVVVVGHTDDTKVSSGAVLRFAPGNDFESEVLRFYVTMTTAMTTAVEDAYLLEVKALGGEGDKLGAGMLESAERTVTGRSRVRGVRGALVKDLLTVVAKMVGLAVSIGRLLVYKIFFSLTS